MNLHEIYKTLLRRGMPEHPWLHYAYGPGSRFHLVDMSKNTHVLSARTAVDDSVARDLIAMHAARWAVAKLLSDFMKDGYEMSAADLTRRHREISAGLLGENEFAAILAATEYLEPKGADDANKS